MRLTGRRAMWKAIGGVTLGLLLSVGMARSQETQGAPAGRGGPFADMQRVAGEVTAINGATLSIKTEDGSAYSIVTTDNTRIMKGAGNTVKLAELKPGDVVMAGGNLDAPNKSLHALMVFATDAAQVKAMRENLGKTFIAGRVLSIDLDNAKMTVERGDHVKQTIGFDETTSFRRGRGGRGQGGFGGGIMMAGPGRAGGQGSGAAGTPPGESITLADIKVGDMVGGQGAIKAGTFVPTLLMVSTPGAGRAGREGGQGAAGTPATPGATSTPVPPPSN